MVTSAGVDAPTVNPYAPPLPGAVFRQASPPPKPAARGHWVWVDGPRQWAGLDLPLIRDWVFWLWAFHMATTTIVTLWTQIDTDKAVSILVVSWVLTTAVYWFIPALARQVWRARRARPAAQVLTVERHPAP